MEAVHLVLLAMVSLSYGDNWDITVSMSPITSPPANTDLSVTFYEREDDTSPGSAHTVTMEISIAIVYNVNMDDIHRPMKIDVWNGREVPGYHFNQLSMTSTSYQFTFECNCSLGIDGTKKVLYPKEDEWEIKITSSAVTNVGSFNYFTILVNDSNGVGQEIDSKFRRRQTTTISVLLHLDDPVSFKTLSFSGGGHTFCIKFVFTHEDTCRVLTFDCWMHSALSVTLQLISTGYLDNCLPTTTVATTSTSPTTTTVPTTTATSTSLSTTTTDECDSTFETTDPSVQQNCRCILRKPMVNLTTSQLQTIVTELQSQLSVNKSTLSSTIRKKTSATDNRPSSRVIGMAGAVFLALPFVLLITCDIIRLFSHRRQTVLVI